MKTKEELYIIYKSTLNSKIATGCTQSDFAQRSTRSTRPRRKIILWPTQRIEELQGNLEQRRWLQNSWNTLFDSRTAGYNTWKRGRKVEREVREPPAQGILPSGLEPDAEDQQVQERIAGIDRRNEQHPDLRALRKLFQKAMPRLQYHWELGIVFCSCGRNLKSSQRPEEFEKTTTTSPLSLAMLLRRIAVAVPNMELLNAKECTTRLKRCCRKLVKKSTEAIYPYLQDDIMTTNTESLCQILDGPRSTQCHMTELPWRIIHTSQENQREFEIRHTE